MNLANIGQLVHKRRTALGLSQARLAVMSGLSRSTINQLENGSLADMCVAKLIVLLDLLGLSLDAAACQGRTDALQLVSQSASVSYKTRLKPEQLATSLAEGSLPKNRVAHIATMLDEMPLSLIVAAVEEVAMNSSVPPKQIWTHVYSWARELQSPRVVWAA